MRDLLASNRTLLAWIRTAVVFAGLSSVVAKFGRGRDMIRDAGYLGIFMVLLGLLPTILRYSQHRSTLAKERPPPVAPLPSGWAAVTAALSCALA